MSTMRAVGILRQSPIAMSSNTRPLVARLLIDHFDVMPCAAGESDETYLDRLLHTLKKDSIDHTYQCNHSIGGTSSVNSHLLEEIWQHIQSWFRKNTGVTIHKECDIRIENTHKHGAVGLFWHNADGNCRIEIDPSVIHNTPYFLIVLVHEYMHYVHYRSVSSRVYYNSPLLFTEGFAEFACRLFHSDCTYDLPDDLKKSWNYYYELGRLVVEQISDEGYGISGFVHSFLRTMKSDNPWKTLDPLFM